SIQAGANVTAAGDTRPVLDFDPTKPGTVSGNYINFTDDTGHSTGDAVVYHVGPGGKAIGGLKDGATYYVIADLNNTKHFQPADSSEHASKGVALALDPSLAAGTDHQFGDTGVSVRAANRAFDFALGQAGGQASTFGLSGAFTVAVVDDTTHAHIDPGAVVKSESAVGVSALDDSTEIGITGGVASAGNLGVGISFGLNLISRDTQAYVGAGIDPSTGQPKTPGSTHTTIDADGPVTVQAVTDGALWTASVAAAVAKSDTPDP